MIDAIKQQFHYPEGWLGHVVAWYMRYNKQIRNEWGTELLDIQPDDTLLEVGFGVGLAIRLMAQQATQGKVLGIDHSPLMIQQASQLNQTMIQAGRVELREGKATYLPYPDKSINKILAINSLHHAEDMPKFLAEVRRVLKPKGRLAVIYEPVPHDKRSAEVILADMAGFLADFPQVEQRHLPLKDGKFIVAVVGWI